MHLISFPVFPSVHNYLEKNRHLVHLDSLAHLVHLAPRNVLHGCPTRKDGQYREVERHFHFLLGNRIFDIAHIDYPPEVYIVTIV